MNDSLWPSSWSLRLPTTLASEGTIGHFSLELPEAVKRTLGEVYWPLAVHLHGRLTGRSTPFVLGINGAQGTGKSTAAVFLGQLLHQFFGYQICILSIDDLYLTRSERERLAQEVHPLLQTRGVPGTHDVELALQLFDALCQAGPETRTDIVRFNKAQDDRFSAEAFDQCQGRPDMIIFEGWCVGAKPQPEKDLDPPCNTLESEQDPDGSWRRYVNEKLEGYQPLFAKLDMLVMLQAPSFEQVYDWRELQEQKLRAGLTPEELRCSHVMSPDQIRHFISHYERLTRWMLSEMPSRADVLFALDESHTISKITIHPSVGEASSV